MRINYSLIIICVGHVYYIRSYDRQSGLCSVMHYVLCDLVMPSPHSCCACVLVCPQQRDDTRADNTRRRLHLLGHHRRGRTLPPIGEVTKAIPSLRTCPYINLDDLSRQARDSHQENSHQQMAFPHSDWTIQRCEKRHFCDAIFRSNASFYQDRLGTNIGKALKKRVVAFFLGPARYCSKAQRGS
jgi:hypothetical protein